MLPIEVYLPKLIATLMQNMSVVLQAEPGAGKSTAVPIGLLKANILNGKKIIMLEPRRVAAKSIAHYLAQQINEEVGHTIGYQIRNECKVSQHTQIEVVTEGVLTRRLQQDPELADIGLLIFDEFHERSLHTDLALMLSLDVQSVYRNDLKILVMSATIDTAQIAQYLQNAPVMQCPGRTFPVTIDYAGRAPAYMSEHVIATVGRELRRQNAGDILVFLAGQAEIRKCIQLARESLHESIELLPLYGSLSLDRQERVLARPSNSRQRVIFSTNIAETSLTIAGITTVIDSGLEKVLTFDVKSGLSRLDTVSVSIASADQRAGRAGRVQAGRCVRLWRRSEHHSLKAFQSEEITIADLTQLVLELSAWGVTSFDQANWLTPPPQRHFASACELNQLLGLLTQSNTITKKGQKALSLGVAPRLAAMLLQCHTRIEISIACIVAALLSERDVFNAVVSADLTDRVIALVDFVKDRNAARKNGVLRIPAMEQVVKLAKSFTQKLGTSIAWDMLNVSIIQQHLGAILLAAYPERLAKLRVVNTNKYLLANGRGVTIKPNDPLFGETWLVVCDCDGKNKDGLVYACVPILHATIKEKLAEQFEQKHQYTLDAKKENVVGRQQLKYKALLIEEVPIQHISQETFTLCVADIVNNEGVKFLNWSERCESWFARAKWLGTIVTDFPQISIEYLHHRIDTWLLPYFAHVKNVKQLKQQDIYELLVANLSWEQQQFLDKNAPEVFLTPSGKKVTIRYDEHQGPTVSVILQEMFGQLTSPTLANNKVPLRFELLSPARRPIQTTSDLANFWRTSYFDVAKDMRGRYPKHRWPEEPLEEPPGRSIKRSKTIKQ